MNSLAEGSVGHGPGNDVRFRLFVLGFQVLFLQLVLIRFLAGYIWHLSYFPNLVLLAAFIGFGFGFLLHWHIPDKASRIAYAFKPALLLLFICFVFIFKPDVFLGFDAERYDIDGEFFFTWIPEKEDKAFGTEFSSFLFWFLGIVAIFFIIGQRMAKLFRLLPPLQAYSLDIVGSLAGIALFIAFSFFQVPASIWFLVVALSFFLAVGSDARPWIRLLAALPPVVIAVMSHVSDNPRHVERLLGNDGKAIETGHRPEKTVEGIAEHSIWSPYQRLTLLPLETENHVKILSNGIGHQVFGQEQTSNLYSGAYRLRSALEKPPFEDVLVIGAGSGNDVRSALENDVKNIDAVDIDPGILQFGHYHSEHYPAPYSVPQVNTIVDDGRHYLHNTDRRYDLIVFALTDSLTKVSSLAQLRLENYLFTLESFRRASETLKPGGWIVLYNAYRDQWLVTKLLQMLTTAMPIGSETLYIPPHPTEANIVPIHIIVAMKPMEEASYPPMDDKEGLLEPATDDWPFPYMKEKRIPIYYLVAMATVIGMVLLALAAFGRRAQRSDPRFAVAFTLLGAAFLLLETKGVIQFSLLFGTTWLNSSLVFFAVLASVLLGIKVAQRVRSPKVLPVAAVLLLLSAAVSLAVPLGSLLAFDPLSRFLLAGALMFTPIFMANLIFSLLFRERQDAELYFGWNLLGATVGGVLEYLSIVTGYQLLGVVVLVLYAVALGAAWLGMRGTSFAPLRIARPVANQPANLIALPVQEKRTADKL